MPARRGFFFCRSAERRTVALPPLPGERWWGGVVAAGVSQPYGAPPWRLALGDTQYNQANPVLISTSGRYIWADDPSAVVQARADGTIELDHAAGADVAVATKAMPGGLRSALAAASAAHFPPSGRHPAAALISRPQYNLWMESNLDRANEPTQAKVLAYADAVLAHGMPPGVLMIDTNWAEHYGSFRFHRGRFPDPGGMCAALHARGFLVALWVSPFVSPDSESFRAFRAAGLLVPDADDPAAPALAEWWDGFSALLDFTRPPACAAFAAGLAQLRQLGVDGFKFDGGDPPFYAQTPHAHCEAFARQGLAHDIAELRACWKLAGTHLAQRQSDRNHAWGDAGLGALLPTAFTAGAAGYAFVCPDMVGGGQFTDFVQADTLQLREGAAVDAELFVRYAQAAALFPMVQFSLAPWRVLPPKHCGLVAAAARLHARLAPELMRLAAHAAATGEPMLRHCAFVYPDGAFLGAEFIADQFMLGDDVLVAPVLSRGAAWRDVALPPGRWVPHDGARGWRLRVAGVERVAAALEAAEQAAAASQADRKPDIKQPDDVADTDGGDAGDADDDSAEGRAVAGPAIVRVAAVDAGGALRGLPWFSRAGAAHRLGLAATAAEGQRLAEAGRFDADENGDHDDAETERLATPDRAAP